MNSLSELPIGGTVYIGGKRRQLVLHTLQVRTRFSVGTWQRLGLGCKLADFYAQENDGDEPMAFRILGQERKL